MTDSPPGPRIFTATDPALRPRPELDALPATTAATLPPDSVPVGRTSWAGRLFWAGVTAAAGLLVAEGAGQMVDWVMQRDDWLSWGMAGALGVAVTGLLLWATGEWLALRRLGRAADLRQAAEDAALAGIPAMQRHIAKVRSALSERADLAPAFARLETYAADAPNGRAMLAALDREIGARLDAACVEAILSAARRTGLVTAVSPFAVLDVAATLALNLRLLRRIAVLTGGRPGTLATWKLVRTVTATLLVAGGVGVADGFIGDFVGGSLARTVSRKAGEGVLNSLLTVRLGLVALRLLRPVPVVEATPPTVASVAARLLGTGGGVPSQAGDKES